MNIRNIVVMLAVILATMSFVSAANLKDMVNVKYVEIDGDKYYPGDDIGSETFKLGETVDVTVKVEAGEYDVEDLQVEVYLSGYKYSHYERELVSDVSKTFDLGAGENDKKDFSLEIPMKLDIREDNKDDIKLRVRFSDRNDIGFEEVYQLNINGVDASDAIKIRDFTVSPSNVVEQGRPLSFKVKVKNYGEDDLDDVSVKVAIPALGILDDETLDKIDVDESETFEELLLRVPKCATPGNYEVVATVKFDEYEETTETMDITVVEGGACTATADVTPTVPKTLITIPESQEVKKGTSGAVYPVMISNMASEAKTYAIDVAGVDAWGTVRVDPGAVVIVPAQTAKTAYLYVAANDDAATGQQVFKVTIAGDGDTKQVVLTANVAEADDAGYNGLRRSLEIGLIVLVIILIILGLIIGFNKLRGDRDSDDDDTQTYY